MQKLTLSSSRSNRRRSDRPEETCPANSPRSTILWVFVAPIKLVARVLLQESWKTNPTWDEELPQQTMDSWDRWHSELTVLENLQVPRSFKPFEEPASVQQAASVQLHVFCDASEKEFGSVAYLRTERSAGVHVGFVAAKAHVSSLKALTIPKLELQAAVVAMRLSTTLKREMRIEIGEPVFGPTLPAFYRGLIQKGSASNRSSKTGQPRSWKVLSRISGAMFQGKKTQLITPAEQQTAP